MHNNFSKFTKSKESKAYTGQRTQQISCASKCSTTWASWLLGNHHLKPLFTLNLLSHSNREYVTHLMHIKLIIIG